MDEEKKGIGQGFRKLAEKSRAVASAITTGIKEETGRLTDRWSQYKSEQDKRKYTPVFGDDLKNKCVSMPAIIQITDCDKRKTDVVCDGAIGYETSVNSVRILTVYREYAASLGVRFYPLLTSGVFYVNPCYPDLYLDIDEYFAYMKQVRVDELENVARLLGAKHFRIELKTKNKNAASAQTALSAGAGRNKPLSVSGKQFSEEYTQVSVAAEISFSGSDVPKRPALVYFKDDTNINSLIEMRMDTENRNSIRSKTYSIQYGKTSGVKAELSADLNTAFGNIGCAGGGNFVKAVSEENQTILEYTIDF